MNLFYMVNHNLVYRLISNKLNATSCSLQANAASLLLRCEVKVNFLHAFYYPANCVSLGLCKR